MAENQPTFIKIERDSIQYAFHSRYIKEENGMYSWYIPAFDIFFSSKDIEEGNTKAKAMTKAFFSFWIQYEGFRSFILQIHKLGFKAPMNHDLTVSNLIKHKISDAKFTSKNFSLPPEFADSAEINQVGEMALA